MTQQKAPVHVCSLSMSPLTVAEKELKAITEKYDQLPQEEREKDVILNCNINRARWVELSIEFNRHIQLQYVYQHLGSKGASPAFRKLKIKPLFNAWKREILRQKWGDVRRALDSIAATKRMSVKKDSFSDQRAALASRSFALKGIIDMRALNGLVEVEQTLKDIFAFQTPESLSSGFVNKEIDYIESTAVTDFSTIPETTQDDDPKPLLIAEEMRQRLKKSTVLQSEVIDKREAQVKERALRIPVEDKDEDEGKQKKNNTNLYIIIAIAVLLVAIIIFAYFKVTGPQKLVCKPTPKPTPKSRWFGKK